MEIYETYFVNKEKGVVVCKLENCASSLACDVCHKGWEPHPLLELEDTFIGKAKCAPDDTFDPEIGKKIAYRRAMIKLYKAKRKTLNDFITLNIKTVDKMVELKDNLTNKYDKAIGRRTNSIENILNNQVK